jgi:predicted DsbA family dithiol-disulfide isomerase
MTGSSKPVLLATVFTDYICPFCYVGDVRLDRLREHFDLKINWCFVEIHPETPVEGMPVSSLGYDDARWQQMMDNLSTMAKEEGISFRPHDFTANSHKSLLLAEAAREADVDVFYRLHRRLFEAFFTEGLNIGDEAVLRDIAHQAGVADNVITSAWSDERFEQRLKEYQAAARQLEVTATPTVFFSQKNRLNGALPYETFLKAARAGAEEQQAGK